MLSEAFVVKDKKGKKHKGKHSKKDKSLAKVKAEGNGHVLAPELLTGEATYADGKPLDNITYLEAKLILKPDPFTSVDAFRDFGKLVQKVAKRTGVGFIFDPEISRRPQIREITFGDTS